MHEFLFWHASPKPSYDNACYCSIQIAASQFYLDKPCNASTSIVQCCEFAAMSGYNSETV